MEELARAIIINNILVGGFILIQAAIMYAFISMPKDVSDQLRHVKDHQRWQDDEKQKLRERCRALEDKLAEIEKRLNEKQDRIDLAEWSYVPREIREMPYESDEESDEEETPLDKYSRNVKEMAERIGKAYCDFMSKSVAERLKGENQ